MGRPLLRIHDATQRIVDRAQLAIVSVRAAALLPDKDAAIVTYCSNISCPNSSQVAAALERLGYTNVRKYAEGIQDWAEAGLPTESELVPNAANTT